MIMKQISILLKVRKLSNLLRASVNFRVIPHSKAVNPTHFLFTRYPHPKSLPSGKGLTFALAGSKSGVSHLRNLSILSICALALTLTSSCAIRLDKKKWMDEAIFRQRNRVEFSGEYVTKDTVVAPFRNLCLQTSFSDYEIVQSDTYKVSIYAPEDFMQYIDLTSDEKGGLSIRASLDNSRIWIVPEETKITVYVPSLEALSVSGSGDVRCRRFENPGELALTISGSTDLKFDFLSATGLSVSAAGSCDLEFGILQAKTADMALAGSGDIEVSDLQVNAVSASVAGSGDVEFRGHAESAKFSVAGSGDINAAKLKCPATSVSVKGSGEIKYQDKDGNVLRTEK